MTIIEYSVPISNIVYKDIIKKNDIINPYGYKFNNVYGEVYKDNSLLKNSSDGWIYNPVITEIDNNTIEINPNLFIQDKQLVHTTMSGLTALPYLIDLFPSDIIELTGFINPSASMGSIVPQGSNGLPTLCIFRNKKNNISVFKKYEYKDVYSEAYLIDRYKYTTFIDPSGDKYVCINESGPILLSEIKNSSLPITTNMLIDASSDYLAVATTLSISDFDFINLCQKISVADINMDMDPNNAFTADITLNTEYFPIDKNVTVIIELQDGTLIQALPDIIDAFDVDCINGAIRLGTCTQLQDNYENIKNFHIFYGVVPQIYFSETSVVEAEYKTETEEPISRYFIDTEHPIFNQYLSTKEINIEIGGLSSVENINYAFSKMQDSIFIEPTVDIIVNGHLVKKNSYHILEDNIGILEIKAPLDPINLLEPLTNTTYRYHLPAIANEHFAVYGQFSTGGAKRVSMACKTLFEGEELYDAELIVSNVGIGDPPDTNNQWIFTEITDVEDPIILLEHAKVMFTPLETGKQIILPMWTDIDNLKVYSYYENTPDPDNIEVDPSTYTFVEPDVVIFNSIDPHKQYTFIITPSVYPIIPIYDQPDQEFGLFIVTPDPLEDLYPSLQDMYLLSSSTGAVNFGYIDSTGTKHYFSESVVVNRLITKQFFERHITGLKSFIY